MNAKNARFVISFYVIKLPLADSALAVVVNGKEAMALREELKRLNAAKAQARMDSR